MLLPTCTFPDGYARVQSLTQVEIAFNQISFIEGFALAPTAFAQLSRCQFVWGLQPTELAVLFIEVHYNFHGPIPYPVHYCTRTGRYESGARLSYTPVQIQPRCTVKWIAFRIHARLEENLINIPYQLCMTPLTLD